MTNTLGVYEAKTRLSEVLERVSNGEAFVITRRGVPVAYLAPIEDRAQKMKTALEELRRIRGQAQTGPETIRELIEEGRRHP